MCFQVKQRLQTAGLQTAGLYIANTRPGGLNFGVDSLQAV